ITRLGRHTASERMATLFLDLHHPCNAVGLVHADGFIVPLTQELHRALHGLSGVHVNHTLQLMRRARVIELKHGRLTLLDTEALKPAAEFRPPSLAYLG